MNVVGLLCINFAYALQKKVQVFCFVPVGFGLQAGPHSRAVRGACVVSVVFVIRMQMAEL